MIDLLKDIESLAKKEELQILDIHSPDPEREKYYRKHFVRVKLEGQLSPLANFLYELQNSSRPLKVENLTMEMKRDALTFSAGILITRIVGQEES